MAESFLKRLTNRILRMLPSSAGRVIRTIQGTGNTLGAEGVSLTRVELDIVGDDNQIVIGRGSALTDLRFRLRGSGQRIEFGSNCRISRGQCCGLRISIAPCRRALLQPWWMCISPSPRTAPG